MRETPYNRLKAAVLRYMSGVDHPNRRPMWVYPKERLHERWPLDWLAQRVQAGDQLGYDVKLRMTDEGLRVEYVKRPSALDYQL